VYPTAPVAQMVAVAQSCNNCHVSHCLWNDYAGAEQRYSKTRGKRGAVRRGRKYAPRAEQRPLPAGNSSPAQTILEHSGRRTIKESAQKKHQSPLPLASLNYFKERAWRGEMSVEVERRSAPAVLPADHVPFPRNPHNGPQIAKPRME
jgi:hypothetical protein